VRVFQVKVISYGEFNITKGSKNAEQIYKYYPVTMFKQPQSNSMLRKTLSCLRPFSTE